MKELKRQWNLKHVMMFYRVNAVEKSRLSRSIFILPQILLKDDIYKTNKMQKKAILKATAMTNECNWFFFPNFCYQQC